MRKRLSLSSSNRWIAGVCGGLGEYFDIDPTVFRIILGVAFLTGGFGFIPYIILWFVLPRDYDKISYGSKQDEDLDASLEQAIFYMKQQYKQAEAEVNIAIEDEKKLYRAYEEQAALRDVWIQKAELAVMKGNDELALEALKRKNQYEQLANQYMEQYEKQKEAVTCLKTSLLELENKIQEAIRKKNIWVAEKNRIKAEEYLQRTITTLNDLNGLNRFEKLKEKVRSMEDRNAAYKEIEEDPLLKKFEQLEKDHTLVDELKILKQKVNNNQPEIL